ncbi:MAG: peptidoglycan DD-metalloendopeptidase family protein [Myxococcaceae bacterium]
MRQPAAILMLLSACGAGCAWGPSAAPRRYHPEPDVFRPAPVSRAAPLLPERAPLVKHRVLPGQTVYRIAKIYGVTQEALCAANGIKDARISVGQELIIPGRAGRAAASLPIVEAVGGGADGAPVESNELPMLSTPTRVSWGGKSFASRNAVGSSTQGDAAAAVTEPSSREGSATGVARETAARANGASAATSSQGSVAGGGRPAGSYRDSGAAGGARQPLSRDNVVGGSRGSASRDSGASRELPSPELLPRKEANTRDESSRTVERDPPRVSSRPVYGRAFNTSRAGPLRWPLRGVLYGRFGRRGHEPHDGIDLAAPAGTPVVTSSPGTVLFAGVQKGYGNIVIVEHQNGFITLYAHNRDLRVKTGQAVRDGQVLATVGDSGKTSGPHLHFEVRVDGRPMDPLRYLGPIPDRG